MFVRYPMKMSAGTTVRLVAIDRYGFQGRDFHPAQGEEGFQGMVVGIIEELASHYVYRVCRLEDGKVLDLVDFEVVKVD